MVWAKTDRINWVNSGLMVASVAAAVVAPFHVFLFSYAILGPLHYLTEISWLHVISMAWDWRLWVR